MRAIRLIALGLSFSLATLGAQLIEHARATSITTTGAGKPSGATIGTPVQIGSLNKTTSSTSTPTTTTTGAISAGDVVIVTNSVISPDINSITISDGSNPTLNLALATNGKSTNGSAKTEHWFVRAGNAVNSGATMTITYSASSVYAITCIVRIPNGAASPLNVAANSTTLPVSTGALSFSPNSVIGTLGGFNFTGATEDGTFTNLCNLTNGPQVINNTAYKNTSSTSSVSYNPTPAGGGGNLTSVIAAYH